VTPAAEHWGWLPLGQMLVQDGILTDEQVATALDRQRKTKERLGQVLIDMRLIDEEVLLKYLGAQFRKEPITRQELGALDLDVVKLIPEEVARQHRVIAAERNGRRLIVATADPLNVVAIDDLRRATGLEIDFRIGPGAAIQEAIDRTYRRMISTEGIDEALRQDLGLSVGLSATAEETIDVKQLRTQADDPPWSRSSTTCSAAPPRSTPPTSTSTARGSNASALSRRRTPLRPPSEVPLAAPGGGVAAQDHLAPDIAERRLQDSSFASRIHGREIDFRVSTCPPSSARRSCSPREGGGGQHYSLESLGLSPISSSTSWDPAAVGHGAPDRAHR
jgi:type IV pilus assembly protein PilB